MPRLTGKPISAQRAYEIGLVTEVVPKEQLLDAALHVARTIASFPQSAVLSTLRTLWAARELTPDQGRIMGNVLLNLGTSTAAKAGASLTAARSGSFSAQPTSRKPARLARLR